MDLGHFAMLCRRTIYAFYQGSKITIEPFVRLGQIIYWSVFSINWSTAGLGAINVDYILKFGHQYIPD